MDAIRLAMAALAVGVTRAPAPAPEPPREPLTRTIHPVVKVLDASKGIVRYIASDESLDSYREVVRAAGWRFDRFKKNAPFVDSHSYGTIGNLVGKVIAYSVVAGQLVEDVQWAIDVPGNELAKLGFQMTEAGYLKAVSVGFVPVRMVSKWDGDDAGFQDAVKQIGMAADTAAIVRTIYLEQQQIELSACVIGANGNAVAKAYAGGALSDEDLDRLADIGERDLTLSQSENHTKTGSASANPADDAAAMVRRERAEWLRELKQLTNRQDHP